MGNEASSKDGGAAPNDGGTISQKLLIVNPLPEVLHA
jgi:hypothetical protein